ncbi:hypothetical protein ACFSTC_61775 [Nonomuraea ferruginea]
MTDLPIALALTAGTVAAFNPCGFAMLPAYLSMLVAGEPPRGAGGVSAARPGGARGDAVGGDDRRVRDRVRTVRAGGDAAGGGGRDGPAVGDDRDRGRPGGAGRLAAGSAGRCSSASPGSPPGPPCRRARSTATGSRTRWPRCRARWGRSWR